ncbi:MAG TPA: glutamine synthetase family protein [Rhizomicrobium sp.]|nr:glutamine synthetase family protein [Rhizomicrobium sp.]
MNKISPPPAFARPAFVACAQAEFEAFAAANPGLGHVDAVLADVVGTLRGKRLAIAEAGKLFESGMQIPHSLYLMDAHGEMTNPFGRGVGDGDPDGTAWPIPGTVSRVWGAPRAQILMSLRDSQGVPDPAEPRAALERVLERFAELNLTPVCALELEFYLIDPRRDGLGAPQPPLDPRTGAREHTASVYGIDDLDRYAGFLASLTDAAAAQGVPVSAASKEYAPGQFEANLRHQGDARLAADHAVFLKQIVRAAARANGLDASFMAKPYQDRAGCGLHIHLSLLDAHGANIFDDGTPQGSERLRHAVGGLQALMADSMALFAPNLNSYRRFQPDMFAPVNRRWGVNNRSAGLRVPVGPGEARRVEHRVAGADANPYYALAAVLAGVHHGLANKLDPGPAAAGNVSREPDLALPFTIDAALARLEQARTLDGYLGGETLSLYRETKRIEAQRLRRIIAPAEYDWYL